MIEITNKSSVRGSLELNALIKHIEIAIHLKDGLQVSFLLHKLQNEFGLKLAIDDETIDYLPEENKSTISTSTEQ